MNSVNIRPGVSVLSVLRHLNYKPWYALAEFVDNSLQSYLRYNEDLVKAGLKKLRVEIRLETEDGGRLTVRDNAAGIHQNDFGRAFRAAAIPPERSGLGEFGMGMKSAACWFSPRWKVRTKALGETITRTVRFDIDSIVRDEIEELSIGQERALPNEHFTEIALETLFKVPQTRTVQKVRDHLASIYRVFLRQGILELVFNDQPLSYESPPILVTPYYRTPNAQPLAWKKNIEFDFGLGLTVRGFAALRERASTSHAGFALFRRGRLIQGSDDEGYRPEQIFGKSNSYRYQRLFGELHLDGFEVSHTKDGFVWDEYEDSFLDLLKDHLNSQPVPLLEQAEEYRVRPRREDVKSAAQTATDRTAAVIERDVPGVLEQLEGQPPAPEPPEAPLSMSSPTVSRRVIEVSLRDSRWQIVLELSDDPAIEDWIELWDAQQALGTSSSGDVRIVGVRMALNHPFVERFAGRDYALVEPIVRIGAALGLAEIAARDAGVRSPGTVRRNVNELLRQAFSKP